MKVPPAFRARVSRLLGSALRVAGLARGDAARPAFRSRVGRYVADVQAAVKAAERGQAGTRRPQSVEELLRAGLESTNRIAVALEGLLDVARWRVSLSAPFEPAVLMHFQILGGSGASRRGRRRGS